MRLKSVLCLLILAFTGSAFAGELEDILSKHYQAMGGKDKMKNVTAMKMEGKYVMATPQGEMEIPFKAVMKEGKKMRVDASFQGTTMVQAVNGDSGWQIMPMMGTTEPQDMNETDLKSFSRLADLHGPLYDYETKGNKLELMGKEEVEGTQAYKIKVTEPDESVVYVYLDAEYYVPIKSETKTSQMGMELDVAAYPSDYKEVDGLMFAYSTTNKSQMGEMVLTVDTLELNPEISDDTFKKPESEKKDEGQ